MYCTTAITFTLLSDLLQAEFSVCHFQMHNLVPGVEGRAKTKTDLSKRKSRAQPCLAAHLTLSRTTWGIFTPLRKHLI